jgi:hypothetical protein
MDDLVTDRQTQPAPIRPGTEYSLILESKPYTRKNLVDNPLLFIIFVLFLHPLKWNKFSILWTFNSTLYGKRLSFILSFPHKTTTRQNRKTPSG